MKYIYLSHPISKGNQFANIHISAKAYIELMNMGFIVYWPGGSVLCEMIMPQHYESWMTQDKAWIDRCDAVVRLAGESNGCDREVLHAKENGIPVFYGVGELQKFMEDQSKDIESVIEKLNKKILPGEELLIGDVDG